MKVIRTRARKVTAVAAAGLMTAAGIALTSPAAHASSGTWNMAVTTPSGPVQVQPGWQFTGSGSLAINGSYLGSPVQVSCTIADGQITYTVPNPIPSGPAGGTIDVPITVPSDLDCTDGLSPDEAAVHITNTTWTLELDLPTGSTVPTTLSGEIQVPANSVTVELCALYGSNSSLSTPCQGLTPPATNPDCVVVGPTGTSPVSFTGQYTPTTGTAGLNPADQNIGINNGQCPNADNGTGDTLLHAATATLHRVGYSSEYPTLIDP